MRISLMPVVGLEPSVGDMRRYTSTNKTLTDQITAGTERAAKTEIMKYANHKPSIEFLDEFDLHKFSTNSVLTGSQTISKFNTSGFVVQVVFNARNALLDVCFDAWYNQGHIGVGLG